MAALKCPICGREVPEGALTTPFCQERCRLLDLGNWLDERYIVDDQPGDVPVPPPSGEARRSLPPAARYSRGLIH